MDRRPDRRRSALRGGQAGQARRQGRLSRPSRPAARRWKCRVRQARNPPRRFRSLVARKIAVRKLCARASSRLSSVSVPGVTRRTTSRRTTALGPRLRASAGSSICSHTATRWPCAIRRWRYSSAAWIGTPHIGMSCPRCLPRLVSAMPSAREAIAGVLEEQLVEIAHAVEQEAIGVRRFDLEKLRHHRRGDGRPRLARARGVARRKSPAFGVSPSLCLGHG